MNSDGAGAGAGGALPKRPEMSRRAPIKLREDDEYGVEREVIKNRAVVGRGRGSDATRRGDLRPIGEKESDL